MAKERKASGVERAAPEYETDGAPALSNRLVKRHRHLGRWARRAGVECYRLYDADLPEYSAAVDVYGPAVHIQEYEAPAEVDRHAAEARLRDLGRAVAWVLDVADGAVHVKVRRRQRGASQYRKQGASGEFFEVREGPCRFLVNLRDYLDTGLFLDHRDTRAMLGELASGRRFLNLFSYTATATCHAIHGGATGSLSIDMSRTYTDWAARNLANNGAGDGHRLLRADCVRWLREPADERFDVIFLDPPTFSNSKRMEAPFDVQKAHVALIRDASRRLADGGVLIFSTNHRRFRMDVASLSGLRTRDITRQTIPRDFEGSPHVHQCWRIEQDDTS